MSIRIQQPEARYETAVSNVKISNSLEEMKKNTPEQSDALKLTISKEGIEKLIRITYTQGNLKRRF